MVTGASDLGGAWGFDRGARASARDLDAPVATRPVQPENKGGGIPALREKEVLRRGAGSGGGLRVLRSFS